MNMSLIILSLVVILTACNNNNESNDESSGDIEVEGATFVEQIKAETGKLRIPYRKYLLENGLKVILHEDYSDPAVSVSLVYHAGSIHETPGKSGFAHLFEHMMFQGSKHVADEQHNKIIQEAGGFSNGTTLPDRTLYFQTVPSNHLEKLLWLESDRMGFLLETLSQEKLDNGREVVKNERRQRVDNKPYGGVQEKVLAALFPADHPASWPVIGHMEDLDRATIQDVKNFFLRWYGPNNATLIVGGDIDSEDTLKMIVRYFSKIPSGPEHVTLEKKPVKVESDRYISMEDDIQGPLITVSYPTVFNGHPDESRLDVINNVLGKGKSSLLYRNLVEKQIARFVSTSHKCFEIFCIFQIRAMIDPESGHTLKEVELTIRDTLRELDQRGITDKDLHIEKIRIEKYFTSRLESLDSKTNLLGVYETIFKNPNYMEEDYSSYLNASKKDTLRAFRQYLYEKPAVIVSVVPIGKKEMAAEEDNFTLPERIAPTASSSSAVEVKPRTTKISFNRNNIPIAGPGKAVQTPDIWRENLANGIRALGTQHHESPQTSFLLKVPAGRYFESAKKSGTSFLLSRMMNQSTQFHSAEEISQKLEMLASTVAVLPGNKYITVYVSTLTSNLDKTMALVKEKLLHPAFDPVDFNKVHAKAMLSTKNRSKSPGFLAAAAFNQLLYGENILAMPISGTKDTLNNITLKDVQQFYSSHFRPGNSQLLILTNLKKAAVLKSFSLFEQWKGQSKEANINLSPPDTTTGIIYLVDKENAPQSLIRIGNRSVKKDITGEFFRLLLMNHPLGGSPSSRLYLNLREDKGFTYGVRSMFRGDEFSGSFLTTTSVRTDVTGESVSELLKEIGQYADSGITAEELSFMQTSIPQSQALKYVQPKAKLGFLAQIIEYDLDPDYAQQQLEILEKMTAKEINKLARKHLNTDEMIIVVVGDAKQVRPQLESLDYKVIDYKVIDYNKSPSD